MASQAGPGDDNANVFSASPASLRGHSPLRRRDSVNSGDANEPNRPRLSPVLSRSFDPNDPEARERQRTMDVDMAMQLQRARRETISVPPATSPYETGAQQQVISPLSPHEQHHIDIAKGEAPLGGDEDFGCDDGVLHPHLPTSSFNLANHLPQAHDPSLLVSIGLPRSNENGEDHSSFALPTYQATASRPVFHFSLMEQFATEERGRLGITSPPLARHQNIGIMTGPAPPTTLAEGVSDPSLSPLRSTPSRKFSHSIPGPRAHRKGVGGKLALFEGNLGAPSPPLPRLGGQSSGSPFMGDTAHSGGPQISVPGGGAIPGMGILHSGHDRPYRFSFYSNSFPAVIHARSLSELPAEGQSFWDLFTGINHDQAVETDIKPTSSSGRPSTAPTPKSNLIANAADKLRHSALYDGGPALSHRRNSNGDLHSKSGGFNGGMIGMGDDLEANTWWLDVLSPTDEEMKMLGQVCFFRKGLSLTQCD